MLFASAVATALYALLLLAAGYWARRARAGDASMDDSELPFVSVLIAARNEEQHLPLCLQALSHQSYPRDRIEFAETATPAAE